MSSRAKAVAEGLAHAWSSGDVDKIASFFTEDCVFEDVCSGQAFRGQEALRAQARSVLAAVPDLRLDITSAFGEDGWIGAEWVETGTIDGRRFSLRGASIALMEGEKLSRESMYTHFDGATWFDA